MINRKDTLKREVFCKIRYRYSLIFLMLLTLFSVDRSYAECILPENLTEIGEEAFYGDKAIQSIVLPSNVSTIGSRAFADTALHTLVIPSTVTDIASDAFENVSTPVLLIATPGSFAVTYALNHEIDFDAETEHRALIIGQFDYPDPNKLEGPKKDIIKIQELLNACGYEITTQTNLTTSEMLAAVSSAFADAGNEDISLLYYSGHGNQWNGGLIGIDMTSQISPTELRNALDKVPGRKIVVVDACYSGALIGRSAVQEESPDPASLFIDAFEKKRMLLFSTLASQQYFVLASSRGAEKSWEDDYGGVCTAAFVRSRISADTNSDGIVTFDEAYHYTKQEVQNIVEPKGKTQTVQVYPENCTWFGLFR